MEYKEVIKTLKAKANKKSLEGMLRFGINPKNTLTGMDVLAIIVKPIHVKVLSYLLSI